MQSSGSPKIRGWIFDVYPSNIGEMAVWIIAENGQRIRLTDKFQPKIYVSGKKEDLEKLVGRIYSNQDIANWCFVYKFAQPTDAEKSRVLEITLKDCRRISSLTNHDPEIRRLHATGSSQLRFAWRPNVFFYS